MNALENNIAVLATAGWEFQTPDAAHLSRHFDDNLEVGSKLPASQKDAVIAAATEALAAAFAAQVNAGQDVSRVELPLDGFSGLGALVPLRSDAPVIRILRDAGTPYEYAVNCHLVAELPTDERVVVIGGRYGPTQKVGIFTIIVGDPGKPMPKPGDESDAAKELTAYWEGMAFLMTQQQLDAATRV